MDFRHPRASVLRHLGNSLPCPRSYGLNPYYGLFCDLAENIAEIHWMVKQYLAGVGFFLGGGR